MAVVGLRGLAARRGDHYSDGVEGTLVVLQSGMAVCVF